MSERNYYVLCDDDCKFPAMTKAQIEAAITNAFNNGIVSTIDTVQDIIEINNNAPIKLWIGTQAELNAITTKEVDVLYLVTDDNSVDEIINDLNEMIAKGQALNDLITSAQDQIDALEEPYNELVEEVYELSDDVDTLNTSVQTANQYADVIRSKGNSRTTLFEGTVQFNEAKTITLSASIADFSRIEIMTKREGTNASGVKFSDLRNGTTVLTQYNTDDFILKETFIKLGVNTELNTMWHISGTSLQLKQIQTASADNLTLTVYGIV